MLLFTSDRRRPSSSENAQTLILQNGVASYAVSDVCRGQLTDRCLSAVQNFIRSRYGFTFPVGNSVSRFLHSLSAAIESPGSRFDVQDDLCAFRPTLTFASYRMKYVVDVDRYHVFKHPLVASKFDLHTTNGRMWIPRDLDPVQDRRDRDRLFLIIQSRFPFTSIRFYTPETRDCLCDLLWDDCCTFPSLTCPIHGNVKDRRRSVVRGQDVAKIDPLIWTGEAVYGVLDGYNPKRFL